LHFQPLIRIIKQRLLEIITAFETTTQLADIPNVKKLQGFKKYYRIRLGDYRLGIELIDENTVLFILIAHRKDIYKNFPQWLLNITDSNFLGAKKFFADFEIL